MTVRRGCCNAPKPSSAVGGADPTCAQSIGMAEGVEAVGREGSLWHKRAEILMRS